jgi:S-adenosylmethionine/arginine decarboxylase-like enzyme
MLKINHLHLLVRAETATAPKESEVDLIICQLNDLVYNIDMKVYMEPRAKYMTDVHNLGMTGIVGLETSHLSVHFFEKPNVDTMTYKSANLVQLCCFTCGDLSTKQISAVIDFLNYYQLLKFNAMIIDRNQELKIINEISFDYK